MVINNNRYRKKTSVEQHRQKQEHMLGQKNKRLNNVISARIIRAVMYKKLN
jgi:hypothetical protein